MSELATGEAGAGIGAGVGEDEREYPLLIRATDGEGKKDVKVKISCVVRPSFLFVFLLLPSPPPLFLLLLLSSFQTSPMAHVAHPLSPLHAQVSPDEFDSFSLAYYALLRSTFHSGLRPKRKKASATASAEAKAKKAAKKAARVAAGGGGGVQAEERKVKEVKGVFTPRLPKVIGPRRGNGVKKRRRLEKRREKVVASWKASKARKAGGE